MRSASRPAAVLINNWCVMKIDGILEDVKPYRLSEITARTFVRLIKPLNHFFSLRIASRILGTWSKIPTIVFQRLLLYLIPYPARGTHWILRNSCCNKTCCLPPVAIITSQPKFNKWFISGMQRVACPRPQSSGATRTMGLF